MVVGVSEGFKKELELRGVGYRAQMKGKTLVLNVGYSHPVEFEEEEGITFETPSATSIIVSGINKEEFLTLSKNLFDKYEVKYYE